MQMKDVIWVFFLSLYNFQSALTSSEWVVVDAVDEREEQ